MTVSKEMVNALEETIDVAFCEVGGPAVLKAKEATQAVINAAWTKFNPEDKDTWPDGHAFAYICLLKDWNNQGFAIRITGKAWHIDKWDHVVAYIDPKTILPSRDWEENDQT